jgi:hypothetical protein
MTVRRARYPRCFEPDAGELAVCNDIVDFLDSADLKGGL